MIKRNSYSRSTHELRFNKILVIRQDRPQQVFLPCQVARSIMRQRDFVVWDTETTGLNDHAKIVSIGAVNKAGDVLLDTLVNPGVPIPEDASEIHGITDEMVKDAPTFEELYSIIKYRLEGKIWVIYNKDFDTARLWYECQRYCLPEIQPAIDYVCSDWQSYGNFQTYAQFLTYCMMNKFAEHYGAWSDYHHSYTWQTLYTACRYYGIKQNKAHHALSDAIDTLQVLKHLALDEDRVENDEDIESW